MNDSQETSVVTADTLNPAHGACSYRNRGSHPVGIQRSLQFEDDGQDYHPTKSKAYSGLSLGGNAIITLILVASTLVTMLVIGQFSLSVYRLGQQEGLNQAMSTELNQLRDSAVSQAQKVLQLQTQLNQAMAACTPPPSPPVKAKATAAAAKASATTQAGKAATQASKTTTQASKVTTQAGKVTTQAGKAVQASVGQQAKGVQKGS